MAFLSKFPGRTSSLLLLVSLSLLSVNSSFAVFPDEPETLENVEAGTAPGGELEREANYVETLQAFKYGKAFIASRLYGPAIVQLEQALEAVPEDADINYYMGIAHLGLEEPSEALPFLLQAINTDDDYYAAYEQLGLAYLQLEQIEEAKALSMRLVEKVAACAETCDEVLSTASASLSAAIESYPALGAIEEIDAGALLFGKEVEISIVYRGAIAEINQGNYQAAIELLKKTKAEAGPHPDVLTYLGFANRKLQQYDQAISYYRQALAFDSAHKAANEYLGELYVEIGDLARAGLQLQKLDELCPFSCAEREELQRWISLVD